jgi:hypothetical protein
MPHSYNGFCTAHTSLCQVQEAADLLIHQLVGWFVNRLAKAVNRPYVAWCEFFQAIRDQSSSYPMDTVYFAVEDEGLNAWRSEALDRVQLESTFEVRGGSEDTQFKLCFSRVSDVCIRILSVPLRYFEERTRVLSIFQGLRIPILIREDRDQGKLCHRYSASDQRKRSNHRRDGVLMNARAQKCLAIDANHDVTFQECDVQKVCNITSTSANIMI